MSDYETMQHDLREVKREAAKQDAITKNMTECRDCHKPVFWATSSRNKPLLMDMEVSEEGEWQVIPTVPGKLLVRYIDTFERGLYKQKTGRAFMGHTCHFDSCSKGEAGTVVDALRRHPAGKAAS